MVKTENKYEIDAKLTKYYSRLIVKRVVNLVLILVGV